MTVVIVKATVLISGPFIGVSLQLARECQGFFVLDFHQDLVDWGSQWGEACEPPCGRLRAPVLPPFSSLSHLLPSILPYVLLSFSLLRPATRLSRSYT